MVMLYGYFFAHYKDDVAFKAYLRWKYTRTIANNPPHQSIWESGKPHALVQTAVPRGSRI